MVSGTRVLGLRFAYAGEPWPLDFVPGSGRLFFAYAFAYLKYCFASFLVSVDDHVIAVQNLAIQYFQGKRILHKLLDGAF